MAVSIDGSPITELSPEGGMTCVSGQPPRADISAQPSRFPHPLHPQMVTGSVDDNPSSLR